MDEAPRGCLGVRAQLAGERAWPSSEDREQEASPPRPHPEVWPENVHVQQTPWCGAQDAL